MMALCRVFGITRQTEDSVVAARPGVNNVLAWTAGRVEEERVGVGARRQLTVGAVVAGRADEEEVTYLGIVSHPREPEHLVFRLGPDSADPFIRGATAPRSASRRC